MTATATEALVEWAFEQRTRGFDDEVLESAQLFVLDWLASAFAGRGTEPGRAILEYTRAQPSGDALVCGETVGRSAEAAAFANGALSHVVEMDDVDRVSIVHPGAVVMPAALAAYGRDGRNGRELLSAIVAGFEVAIRFGSAVGAKHYYHFHNTSTCGIFGSAMAAGWLRGLDSEALTWALGNAGTMAFGLWEFNAEGAMSKHLHTGHAAASGFRAAELAAHGFTGARSIVEGERGFFAGLAPQGEPDKVTAGLGEPPLALPGVSLKPYASCRHTHAAIDAAMALREQLDGGAVERGTISVYQAAADLCDNPSPKTRHRDARLRLHVNSVICRENVVEMLELGRIMRERFDLDGHYFQIIRGEPMDPTLLEVHKDTLEQLHQDLKPVYEHYASKVGARNSWLGKATYLGVLGLYHEIQAANLERRHRWPMPCTAAQNIAVLDANGDIRSCELRERLGNLRDYDCDWSRFWQSRERTDEMAAIERDGCWCTHVCFIHASLKATKKALAIDVPRAYLHQIDSRKETDVKRFANRA